ncbi:MAG TPA: lipoyl(octanoyl) transferase LipB [Chloroflexota bacterium]|nr:lipoyl(octanoyl) transferase LipB [Chloroflexota bacterium]
MSEVWLLDLGRVEYGAAYELQRRLQAERDADRVPDLLLLVEHPPVITLGRRGSREDVFLTDQQLADRGIGVYETNRGGLVTYHGPGQVVGYPIARLRALAGDAPTYVWRLEETIIRTLARYQIEARRDAGNRGVFAHGGKIAAIGVAVTHGVTMHGFAVNVCPDLDQFTLIDPCGIGDLGVTSVERLNGQAPDLAEVRSALATQFGIVFDRTVSPAPWTLWELIGSWGLLEAPVTAREIRPINS